MIYADVNDDLILSFLVARWNNFCLFCFRGLFGLRGCHLIKRKSRDARRKRCNAQKWNWLTMPRIVACGIRRWIWFFKRKIELKKKWLKFNFLNFFFKKFKKLGKLLRECGNIFDDKGNLLQNLSQFFQFFLV